MDLQHMQSLAERVSPATGYHHVGDLAWNWIFGHDQPRELWRDDGKVVGWAWLDGPDSAMIQVDPGRADVADAAVGWALARGVARLEVARTESTLAAAVRRAGFTLVTGGPFMLLMGRPLAAAAPLPPVPSLPDGFVVRPARPADGEAWVTAHAAAFGSSDMTGDSYRELTRLPPYRAEFAQVIEASDGTCAAYCQGWYDDANRIGEFEPVGTHPSYQRRGLGRAVCLAVLHAFAAGGGERAVVYSRGDAAYPVPKLVYGSLGFVEFTRTDWYVR
jgi:ribosomal protein S18 acetylase RimI-like enzyme